MFATDKKYGVRKLFKDGEVLIASSILINQSAIRTLGQFFDRLTIKSKHQLVTTEIYRFVCHPIYFSYTATCK